MMDNSIHLDPNEDIDRSENLDLLLAKPQVAPSTFSGEVVSDPGEKLRIAREARNWAQTEIATKLRLTTNVVKALEENDLANLPSLTFVRGYVRGYAGLVGIDPKPLIPFYDRSSSPVLSATACAKTDTHGDKGWRLFTYVVVLGLIGLVAIWWQSRYAPEGNKIDTLPKSSESATHSNNFENPSNALGTNNPPAREMAEILTSGPPPEESPTPTTAKHDTTPATGSSPGSSEHSVTSTSTTGSPETQVTTPTPPNPSGAEPPSSSTLVVRTTSESWVKIQDAKGKVLTNSPLKADQSKSFQGQPPFKVHLSRARGVTLEYNGQPFDFKSHVKGKGARFTVGDN
ncbi:cytoskeleton protein RodZ [Gammaproteobacteria bacterium]